MEEKEQYAVLIDADNISSKYVADIFNELNTYGFASIRRIYGNWAKSNGWNEELLLEYSIMPIQQFSYTTGKNATDMAMVIDAMDILYDGKVQGFCIVTSDSDFTRLAMRLREENKFVIGMGESKTPVALARACNKFIHLNLISAGDHEETLAAAVTAGDKKVVEEISSITSVKEIEKEIISYINESGDNIAALGMVGKRLGEKYTDFDVRNYGYTKLSLFIKGELKNLTISHKNGIYFVGQKLSLTQEKVEREVIVFIKKSGGTIDNLSSINEMLKTRYPNFNLRDYGYSRFSSFLRSLDSLTVSANKVRLKRKAGQNKQ